MAHLMVRFESAKGISWGRLQGPAPASASDTVEVSPLDVNPATTRELLGLTEKGLAFGSAIRLLASALLSPCDNGCTPGVSGAQLSGACGRGTAGDATLESHLCQGQQRAQRPVRADRATRGGGAARL